MNEQERAQRRAEAAQLREDLRLANLMWQEFLEDCCAGQSELVEGWRAALASAVHSIQQIVYRDSDADDRDDARTAISSLAGMWLTDDEKDAMYEARRARHGAGPWMGGDGGQSPALTAIISEEQERFGGGNGGPGPAELALIRENMGRFPQS